jgi:hypothetical protein
MLGRERIIFTFLRKTAFEFTYKNIVNIQNNKLFEFCVMLRVTIHNRILKQLDNTLHPISCTEVTDAYSYAHFRLYPTTESDKITFHSIFRQCSWSLRKLT